MIMKSYTTSPLSPLLLGEGPGERCVEFLLQLFMLSLVIKTHPYEKIAILSFYGVRAGNTGATNTKTSIACQKLDGHYR